MKRCLVPVLFFVIVASAFAIEPQTIGSVHAKIAPDSKDVTVTFSVSPEKGFSIWLGADRSYAFRLEERAVLLGLVESSAKRIDIATANKTTIAYRQGVGRFATSGAALVSVFFVTEGYGTSSTVVQFTNSGSTEILTFNQQETRDFIALLEKAHSAVDEYNRQVILFK
jgi:hypothetical protein